MWASRSPASFPFVDFGEAEAVVAAVELALEVKPQHRRAWEVATIVEKAGPDKRTIASVFWLCGSENPPVAKTKMLVISNRKKNVQKQSVSAHFMGFRGTECSRP